MKSNYYVYNGIKSIPLDQYPDDAWKWLSGKPDSADTGSPKQYFRAVPWLYRGVTLRAGAVASMPFTIYRGENEFDTSLNWQNKVGFMPNPRLLFWLLEACLTLEPTAYLFSDNNGARRLRLRYIVPDSVIPKQYDSPDRRSKTQGFDYFERSVNDVPKAFQPAQEIIYFWRPSPYVEQYAEPGVESPAKAALMAAGVIANIDQFTAGFFKRGAIKVTLFQTDGMSKSDADKFENWWNNFVSGVRNAFRTRILNANKVTPVVVGEGLESLKETGLTQQKREDIATALGVPQTKLFSTGAGGIGGGGVVDADDVRFLQETIIPECDFLDEVLNDQVFKPMGLHLRHNYETLDLFQEDEAARATAMSAFMDAVDKCGDFEMFQAMIKIHGVEVDEEALALIQQHYTAKSKRAAAMANQLDQSAQPEPPEQEQEPESETEPEPAKAMPPVLSIEALHDLEIWRRKALKAVGKGETVTFTTTVVPDDVYTMISTGLATAQTAEDVRRIFAAVTTAPVETRTDDGKIVAGLLEGIKMAVEALGRAE